jgi:hypothetical protein
MGMNALSGVRAGNAGSLGPSGIAISDCDIPSNGSGVLVSTGGQILTANDNRITGNGVDGCAGCTADSGAKQ